jgi:hypothetical protein
MAVETVAHISQYIRSQINVLRRRKDGQTLVGLGFLHTIIRLVDVRHSIVRGGLSYDHLSC